MKLLKNYSDEAEAYIEKGMLADSGIKTILVYNSLSDVFPAPGAGTLDINLYVDDADLPQALTLLNTVSQQA
ncbi:MAG: DUF2007 domain-containing protein [Muribaculaceae bacterium]|nr:DUF2007 domain-containing protein [Muribaculaceae bacterium]